MKVRIEVVDTVRIEQQGPPLDPRGDIPFGEQELGQYQQSWPVTSVLSSTLHKGDDIKQFSLIRPKGRPEATYRCEMP